MTTQKIYGIYDKDLDLIFINLEQNDAIAIRKFTDLVNDEKTDINKHPENFSLHRVTIVEYPSRKILQNESELIMRAEECLIKQDKK